MFKKHTLQNGLRIVMEHIPHVRSISIGVWIETGSRDENGENSGISHFIEHMLFKGTERRSAKDIADQVDSVGGQINAFTGKECTCYYIKMLDTHYDLALDLLADMLFHSKFDPQEIDKERSVILEEISMYEDSPEDLAHDLLAKTIFQDNTLGCPILGTPESLHKIDREVILQYIRQHYLPERAVISVAGNFQEAALLETIEKAFGHWQPGEKPAARLETLQYHYQFAQRVKDIEQTHLCIAYQGIPLGHRAMYPLLVVNNILGGSMSSRLFQKIREERGLAYSVYTYPSSYKDGGLFTIYAGMNPSQLEEVCSLIKEEIQTLYRDSITEEELAKTKEQIKGGYILGLESTSSRMTAMGKSELLMGKVYSQKEVIQMIDQVTLEQVTDIIRQVFAPQALAIALVSSQKQENLIEKIFTV